MNCNYKNYRDIEYVTQEEINKMSYNEKFFPPCKCGKKGEFRWIESNKGMFYSITPLKGKNGEEMCHKCAPCAKCGKEACGDSFIKYEKTNDNPSGKWGLAHCSAKCFNGEKPSLPKKEPREVDNCNYCGKLTKVKFGNTNTEKTFCSRDCYVVAGNKIQKGKCRIAGCSQEAYYECMDLCLGHSKPCKGGKIRPGEKVCNAAMGVDEGDICEFCKDQNETYRPNPAALAPQSITNENNESDNSKPNPEKDNPFEVKNSAKTIKLENKESGGKNNFANSTEKSPNETDNKTLVINLSDIKRITLTSQGQLIVEFNNSKSHNMTAEQVNNNSELQTIKSYCQKSGKSSLSRSELDKIFSTNETNTGSVGKPTDNNHALAIGLSVAVALIIGLAIGLLLKRKKNIKRS